MRLFSPRLVLLLFLALGCIGCAGKSKMPVINGTGPNPELPPPSRSLIPTVHVVTAKGWPPDGKPVAAEGMAVVAFARQLDHPRGSRRLASYGRP
jgi:hypothetical protein